MPSSQEDVKMRLAKAESAVESLTTELRTAQAVKKAAVSKLAEARQTIADLQQGRDAYIRNAEEPKNEVITNLQRERDEYFTNAEELKVENGKLWDDIHKLEKMNTDLCQIIDKSADSIDAEWTTSQRYLKECHRLRNQLIQSDTQNRSLRRALDQAGRPVVEVIEEEETT
jgi:chromosome segregation ATPase